MCRGCGVEQTRPSRAMASHGAAPQPKGDPTPLAWLGLLGGSAPPWDGTGGLQGEAVLGHRGRDGVQGVCVRGAGRGLRAWLGAELLIPPLFPFPVPISGPGKLAVPGMGQHRSSS